MEHVDCIDFPNGKGYTPCSQEYRDTYDARNEICDLNDGEFLKDLSPEDYEKWSRLDDKLAQLQMNGHTGKSEFF